MQCTRKRARTSMAIMRQPQTYPGPLQKMFDMVIVIDVVQKDMPEDLGGFKIPEQLVPAMEEEKKGREKKRNENAELGEEEDEEYEEEDEE